MGVDTHVARCTGQRLPLTVWDMLLRFRIPILLGHSKVNDVNYIGGLRVRATDEEVVWFDITVDQVLFVDSLNAGELLMLKRRIWSRGQKTKKTYHLFGNHNHGLDGESSIAVVEEVLETRTEQVDHEDIMQTLLAKVVDIGDAS